MRSYHAYCAINQALFGGPSCGWSSCSFWMCSFASKTPSEVKTLTAGTTSPALASASALFTELKEPYLRTTLGVFHSSFEHSFSLNNPMFWRALLTTTTACLSYYWGGWVWEGWTDLQGRPSSQPGQVKLGLSQGWRMVFWSLCNKGTGVSQGMKRSYRFKFIEELSLPFCRVYKLFFFWWWAMAKITSGAMLLVARVSLRSQALQSHTLPNL